jgi:CRP/FNR family nitrogen fixation transcriptional regulator
MSEPISARIAPSAAVPPAALPAPGWGGGKAEAASAAARLLDALRPLGAVRRLQRGQEIFAEGEPATHWYWLSSGAVEVCAVAEGGRRHVAELVLPGDFFGLEACAARAASAEAVRDTVLLVFPRDRAEAVVDADAALARAFRLLACGRLHEAQMRLLRIGRMSALGRVASFLLELAERRQRHGVAAVEIPITRDGIADYLGLNSETVSRALTELRRRGAIAIPARQSIELADRRALLEAQAVGR